MKTLKILATICFIGLLLQIFAFINLKVSYKYEVDLMETNIKTEGGDVTGVSTIRKLKDLENRKQEILHQQRVTKVLFWVFLTALVVLIIILIKKNNSTNTASFVENNSIRG